MADQTESNPSLDSKKTENAATLAWAQRWLSAPRLEPYFAACDGDIDRALELHEWNVPSRPQPPTRPYFVRSRPCVPTRSSGYTAAASKPPSSGTPVSIPHLRRWSCDSQTQQARHAHV